MAPIHKHYSGVRYHTWRKRDPELHHPSQCLLSENIWCFDDTWMLIGSLSPLNWIIAIQTASFGPSSTVFRLLLFFFVWFGGMKVRHVIKWHQTGAKHAPRRRRSHDSCFVLQSGRHWRLGCDFKACGERKYKSIVIHQKYSGCYNCFCQFGVVGMEGVSVNLR